MQPVVVDACNVVCLSVCQAACICVLDTRISQANVAELIEMAFGVGVARVWQFATSIIVTGTLMPYRITQCYLSPGRRDIPAFTASQLKPVLNLATREGCKAELT